MFQKRESLDVAMDVVSKVRGLERCDRLDYAVYNKTNGMRCPRAAVIGWGMVRSVSGSSRFCARLPRQAEYYHRSRL
jgi:hypothetical protein